MEDIQLKMIDKFLDKLFEKKIPLTEDEMDELEEDEKQGVLMVWERVGTFKKVLICQCGKRQPLVKIAMILEANGYEVSVQ